MRVICTAGHVDHGKSTLVRALTGIEPDRLEEEQRRGLTIDIGFAWTDLDQVGTVAFVDLPGHERFVPNMLAGAGPVRAALFVVAADEGWMPQSEEHRVILELLGIDQVVVALTRCDLVDEETVEIAAELLAEELHREHTALQHAPIIPVSARTGLGMDRLRTAIATMVQAAPPPPDTGRARLWVDRSFTIKGIGTVVTGTLADGNLSVRQDVTVLPSGTRSRVKGLHALNQPIDQAPPGSRVAVNLVGVDHDEVGRGDVVTTAAWAVTDVVHAHVRPQGQPESSPAGVTRPIAIGRRGAWTAHVGTAALPCEVFPIDGRPIAPGGNGLVRIEFASPLPIAVGDRVILRESGRGVTAGGGVILDPAPGPRVRGRRARAEYMLRTNHRLDLRNPADRAASLLAIRGSDSLERILTHANVAAADLADCTIAGDHVIGLAQWEQWSGLAVSAVVNTHQRRPALSAVDKQIPRQLLASAECPADTIDPILTELVRQGRLDAVPGGVAAPGHQPRLTVAQQSARTALLSALDSAGVEAPALRALADRCDADADLLTALRTDGQLIDLPGTDRVMSTAAVGRMVDTLRAAVHDQAFTASQARDALETSRKFIVPALEALDALGHTTRQGDLRTLVR